MSLASGTRLGPHEVVGLIGEGGTGEVYEARDTRLDLTVAIKVLPSELSADADPSTGSGSSRGSTNSSRPELAEGRAKSRDERRARFEYDPPAIHFVGVPPRCDDVASDGQRFCGSRVRSAPPFPPVTQVSLIRNWFEELKRKVPARAS
jgi:serine/threonine protein kinase